MITQKQLKEILDYNPETGVFTWLKKPNKNCKFSIGDRAGRIDARGYRVIWINKRDWTEHVLAFIIMTGCKPTDMVDHADRVKDNNAWLNLRECNKRQNAQNSMRKANTASIYKGVSRMRNKWRARIVVDGKNISLGHFFDKKIAARAYDKSATFHFGEFAAINGV